MAACDRVDVEKPNTPPKPPIMKEIPTNKIDDGLRLCDRNIRQFVKDVRILKKESSDYHAIALAIFAFEELAKYSELKKAKESATQSTVKIDKRLLGGPGAHSYKQNIARKLIPSEAMIVMLAAFDGRPYRARRINIRAVRRCFYHFVAASTSKRGSCIKPHGKGVDLLCGYIANMLSLSLRSFCVKGFLSF
jgi:hypothetical protein